MSFCHHSTGLLLQHSQFIFEIFFFIFYFSFPSAVDKSPEDILRERFAEMNIDLEAFSSLRYVGIQTQQPPTDYTLLQNALQLEIDNTAVRSPRQPDVIFKAIDVINDFI